VWGRFRWVDSRGGFLVVAGGAGWFSGFGFFLAGGGGGGWSVTQPRLDERFRFVGGWLSVCGDDATPLG